MSVTLNSVVRVRETARFRAHTTNHNRSIPFRYPIRPITPALNSKLATACSAATSPGQSLQHFWEFDLRVQPSLIHRPPPVTCIPRCFLFIYKRGRVGRQILTQDLPTHLTSPQLTDVFALYPVHSRPSLLDCSQWLMRSNHRSSARSYNSRSGIPTISATTKQLNIFIALRPRRGRPVRARVVQPL